uniref:Uncharacterized protein n=1 Tax=Bracon brevicornis TaxID=1563983 RepID=A0A6V7L7T2_9HYME
MTWVDNCKASDSTSYEVMLIFRERLVVEDRAACDTETGWSRLVSKIRDKTLTISLRYIQEETETILRPARGSRQDLDETLGIQWLLGQAVFDCQESFE